MLSDLSRDGDLDDRERARYPARCGRESPRVGRNACRRPGSAAGRQPGQPFVARGRTRNSSVSAGASDRRGPGLEPAVRELIVGRSAQRQFRGLELGSRITLRGVDWTVVGVFESRGDRHEAELITGAETLQSAFRRSYIPVGGGTARLCGIVRRLQCVPGRDPSLSVDVMRETDYDEQQSRSFTRVLTIVAYLVGGIMALGAVFGALNSMYTAVSGRTVEIATLRVLGFGSTPVVVSVFAEALLLALLGGVLGACLAWLLFDGHRHEHERRRRDAACRSTGRRATYHCAWRTFGPASSGWSERAFLPFTQLAHHWRRPCVAADPMRGRASMTACVTACSLGIGTPLLDLPARWLGRVRRHEDLGRPLLPAPAMAAGRHRSPAAAWSGAGRHACVAGLRQASQLAHAEQGPAGVAHRRRGPRAGRALRNCHLSSRRSRRSRIPASSDVSFGHRRRARPRPAAEYRSTGPSCSWCGMALYFGALALRQYRTAELRESELARALQLAELRLLKSQLNPHFLFNALNTVRSLIAEDPPRAQDAVTRLANTLRYTLSSAQEELVTLEQELEIVQDYLGDRVAASRGSIEHRLRCHRRRAPGANSGHAAADRRGECHQARDCGVAGRGRAQDPR